jgi:ABC-type transport system involved in multi-copper enzyme maturation permease subunit
MAALAAGFGGIRPRWTDLRAATGFEWRLFWRRRRLRGTALLAALPVLLALLIALLKTVNLEWLQPILPRGVDILPLFFVVAYLRVLLVVLPLLLGASLVAREVEAGTLAYLLVRPLSRASLLLGKCLGAWLVASVLLGVSFLLAALLLLGADGFAEAGPSLRQLPSYLVSLWLGSLAYGAIFTLVGLTSRRPGLVGLFLAFGWESAIPYLPGLIRSFTVRYHLVALVPDAGLPLGALGALAAPSVPSALLWLVAGSAVLLTLSVFIFSQRDYP